MEGGQGSQEVRIIDQTVQTSGLIFHALCGNKIYFKLN